MLSGQKRSTRQGSTESEISPAQPPKDSTVAKLPQEVIDEIIDEIPSNLDLKSSSLVGRAWTNRSQQKLFRHIVLAPGDVKLWLSRTKETAAAITPRITKFELRGNQKSISGTMPWDNTPVLTDLIGSLAESPIRHLTITPFYMGRFQKTSLLRCFEPIADSLCSLELRFLKTYVPVLITLISMFPNLDDIFLDRVDATPMRWPYGERDFDFVPSFAGTFEYLDLYDGTQSFFLSWIMDFPLHFHTISPGVLAKDDLPTFSKLVTMCAPTLREIPYIMFGEDVQPEHVVDILSPCTNLRRVGVCGNQLYRMCPVVEAMLRSLRSRHISVIYLEIVETLRTLQIDKVWNDEGWGQFEDFLCQLAEERIDNGEPLVLELGIWRDPQLKAYGPLNPGTILPRFRERGLIKLAPPPEDLDCAAVLDVKYSGSRGVSSGILLALAGLSR